MSDITAAKLTEVYIKIRDARDTLAKEYAAKDADLEKQLGMVAAKLLEICKEEDLDSLRTNAGTVTRKVNTRYWTSDWHAMYEFIQEHGAFDLLEKRIHQTAMKTFMQENPDVLPPGLNAESKYTVSVRRAK